MLNALPRANITICTDYQQEHCMLSDISKRDLRLHEYDERVLFKKQMFVAE